MDSRDRHARIERMKREKLRQERLRQRQIEVVKRCLVVGAVVGVLLLLIVGVWALAKPNTPKETPQSDNVETQVDSTTEGEAPDVDNSGDEENSTEEDLLTQTQSAEKQRINDGPAAQKPIADLETINHAVPGWQIDDDGWWYANSDNTYYENGWATLEGKQYFFNSDGYMQTGWTPIGGKGYFFDEAGQHVTDKSTNMIALTFDDGPGKHTERLLEVLKENDAKATFFLVGRSLEGENGHIVSRISEDGHELGNHTATHADLTSLNEDGIREELNKVDELVGEFLPGTKTEVTRPPYGANNEMVLDNINTPVVFWSIDTNDWQTRDAEKINEVAMTAQVGDIVLMHDIHQETVDACETLIPKLIAAGFELVTVDELAKARGVEMEAGKSYYGFTDFDLERMNETSTDLETSEDSE